MQIPATGPRIERRFIMPSGFRQDLARPGLDTAVHHWRLKFLETIHLDRERPSLVHRCLEIDMLQQLSTFFQLTFSSFLKTSFSSSAFLLHVSDRFAVITSLVDVTSKSGTVHRGGSKAAIGCWTADPRCISTAGW